MSVLLLGGTGEARDLARALHDSGTDVVSSLAGRVQRPRLPVGPTRVGGFGGVAGLADYLTAEGIRAVVDATHPFAARISAHATQACGRAGVPLLRLTRPGWAAVPGARRWHWVGDHDEAAGTAARLGGCVFVTTGRQHLAHFTGPLADHRVLVRVVDPVQERLPATWTMLLGRGPYSVADERRLMREHDVEVLVTKDSGGQHTRAKLDVAEELGVEVVVVRRPEPEAGESVSDVDAALRWLARLRA